MNSRKVTLCYCYTLAKRSSCSPTGQNPPHVFPQTYIYWPQVIQLFCSYKYWCLVSSRLGWTVARGAGGKHKMEEVSSTINSYNHGTSLALLLSTINLEQYNREKDLEICALKIRIPSNSLIIICIYRSPTGNFNYFLNQLESILNKIYKVSMDLILCGDFNINHLDDTPRKHLLESLLASFNLFSTVKFPTRTFNNSRTLIDNIYINTNAYNFAVSPLINGLSDHDVQIINLTHILSTTSKRLLSFSRRIDSDSIFKFTDLLSYENWEDVFVDNNVNILFNNFLNTFLKIFYACFPTRKKNEHKISKPWLTTGIRISCANKRKMYATYRISNNPNYRAYYKNYCKILSSVITTAKKNAL